ncbi:MAG: zf-HC2 domain-containing protein [Gammaproteobacteria bacterium]|nr:zf-HC2 domain-containing protein [Gammaproteobacteria bacterium]
MHEQITQLDHDEVDLLLPWFVNDTLAGAQRQRVQLHLESCMACQDSVALLQRMQSAAQTDAAVPIVPSPRMNDLMSAIAMDEPRQTPRNWWPAVALAASVAAILLVATQIVYNPALAPDPEVRFETATSDADAVGLMDYVMAVEFKPGTTAINRLQAFEAYDVAEFVAESKPDTYRIMIRLPVSSLEDLERVTNDMESHADIRSVRILALQVPMR